MRTAYIYNVLKRWIFVIAVFVLILMNYLSNAIPFGGVNNAEVSAKYDTLITPAGYAFSIWGLIYLSLAIFAVFQLTKGKHIRFYAIIWPLAIVNFIANILWLFAFQNEWLGVSVLLMGVILISLILIMRVFYRVKDALSTTHRYFFQFPFSLYFGWVSVAAIVNIAVFIVSLDISFFMQTPELYAIILLVCGSILGLYFLLAHKDYTYCIAVAWAYVAIWVAHEEASDVMLTAKIASILLVSAAAVHFILDRIRVAQFGNSSS